MDNLKKIVVALIGLEPNLRVSDFGADYIVVRSYETGESVRITVAGGEYTVCELYEEEYDDEVEED